MLMQQMTKMSNSPVAYCEVGPPWTDRGCRGGTDAGAIQKRHSMEMYLTAFWAIVFGGSWFMRHRDRTRVAAWEYLQELEDLASKAAQQAAREGNFERTRQLDQIHDALHACRMEREAGETIEPNDLPMILAGIRLAKADKSIALVRNVDDRRKKVRAALDGLSERMARRLSLQT
jgi:hypothetical protein